MHVLHLRCPICRAHFSFSSIQKMSKQNMKGEKMFDKMSAQCEALNVASGAKKYINGACVLTDKDGDKIFSTFDTRDLDKSQPDMKCGTDIIAGGTGKYAAITGTEPFACISNARVAGAAAHPMDIPHNTTREIEASLGGRVHAVIASFLLSCGRPARH